MDADQGRRGVAVGGRDEQVLRRPAQVARGDLPGPVDQVAADHPEVADGDRQGSRPVVQRQAADAEVVVDLDDRPAAHDDAAVGRPDRKRDVAGSRPGPRQPNRGVGPRPPRSGRGHQRRRGQEGAAGQSIWRTRHDGFPGRGTGSRGIDAAMPEVGSRTPTHPWRVDDRRTRLPDAARDVKVLAWPSTIDTSHETEATPRLGDAASRCLSECPRSPDSISIRPCRSARPRAPSCTAG